MQASVEMMMMMAFAESNSKSRIFYLKYATFITDKTNFPFSRSDIRKSQVKSQNQQ